MLSVKNEKIKLKDFKYVFGNVDKNNKNSVFINGITKIKLVNDFEYTKSLIKYMKKEIKCYLYQHLSDFNLHPKYMFDFSFSENRLKITDKCIIKFEIVVFPNKYCDNDKIIDLIKSLNSVIYNDNKIKNYLY